MKVLDLFAGAGLFGLGWTLEGYDVIAGVDHNADACATWKLNHPTGEAINADMRSIDPADLPAADVIIASPPCQGFSGLANSTQHDESLNDLWERAVSVIACQQPAAFVIENVPNWQRSPEYLRFLAAARNDLSAYSVAAAVVYAAWYGDAQIRRRLLIAGTRRSRLAWPPPATHGTVTEPTLWDADIRPLRTIRDAIGDLLPPRPGAAIPGDLHAERPMNEQERLCASRIEPGESFDQLIEREPEIVPERLVECAKRGSSWHKQYRRLRWDEQAPAIAASCCKLIPPVGDRYLTLREMARIMSVPDSYRFVGSCSSIQTQIGNAVPVETARAAARQIAASA